MSEIYKRTKLDVKVKLFIINQFKCLLYLSTYIAMSMSTHQYRSLGKSKLTKMKNNIDEKNAITSYETKENMKQW